MVEPSFMAINWLFRKVRTQPCTSTCWFSALLERSSLILVRFIADKMPRRDGSQKTKNPMDFHSCRWPFIDLASDDRHASEEVGKIQAFVVI